MNIVGNAITNGAIEVDGSGSVSAGSVSVTNNVVSGGGLTIQNPASAATTISGNSLTGPGDNGISLQNIQGGSYLISGNAISHYSGTDIYVPYGFPNSLTIVGNLVTANSSGLVAMTEPTLPLTVTGNTFSGNSAGILNGSSFYVFGPAAITNNTISNNSNPAGGGVAVLPYNLTSFTGNIVTGNSTLTGASGGIVVTQGLLDVGNNDIFGNTAGGVANPPASATHGGGMKVGAIVADAGAGPASASALASFLSLTQTKGVNAIQLTGSSEILNLASGANQKAITTVTVPSSTVTGTYYLIACANDGAFVLERNPNNDCKTAVTQVLVQ